VKAASEASIQIAIVEYLSLICRSHKFIFFSIPNESMTPKDGKKLSGKEYGRINRLKKMGLTPGVSDLEIVYKGSAYFLEVKRPGRAGSRLSESQNIFMKNSSAAGARYAIVRSVDDVIDALRIWRII